MTDDVAPLPPQDHRAERAVLSAILLDATNLDRVPDLREEHFACEANRQIFRACRALHAQRRKIDVLTVGGHLQDEDRLAQVGGSPYLSEVLHGSPVIDNVAEHAARVQSKYRAREVITAARRITARGYAGHGDDEAFIADAKAEFDRATSIAAPRTGWDARTHAVSAEWFTRKPPPRRWLLRDSRARGAGMLPLGRVGLFVGAGGVGKTLALAQLATSIATGAPWLGTFEIAAAGRVYLVLAEEDHDEVQRRLYEVGRALPGARPPDGSIVVSAFTGESCSMLERDRSGNLAATAFLPWLRQKARSIPDLRLVVLDPFSRFAGPDAEKDNACATRSVEALEGLAVVTGATVLAGHHTGQAARSGATSGSPDARATAARGVTGLTDAVRWVSTLQAREIEGLPADVGRRLSEVVTFDWAKSNYSVRWAPVELRRDREHGGVLVPLDDADRRMIQDATPPPAREGRPSNRSARTTPRPPNGDSTSSRYDEEA
jgi:hypothetical protein